MSELLASSPLGSPMWDCECDEGDEDGDDEGDENGDDADDALGVDDADDALGVDDVGGDNEMSVDLFNDAVS